MNNLVQSLPAHDQRAVLDSVICDLAWKFLQRGPNLVEDKESLMKNAPTIGGVAAVIIGLVQDSNSLQAHIINQLTSTTGKYIGLGLNTRRAVIATLALSQGKLPSRVCGRS